MRTLKLLATYVLTINLGLIPLFASAQTTLGQGQSANAKITIIGSIGTPYQTPTCEFPTNRYERILTLNEAKIPSYDYYFGAQATTPITNWADRTLISSDTAYETAGRDIDIVFSCTNKPKGVSLSIKPNGTYQNRYAASGYDKLVYADQMSTDSTNKKIGFVLLSNRFASGYGDILNVSTLRNSTLVPLRSIEASDCGTSGVSAGSPGYCTVTMTFAALFVGADITTPLTTQYLPYSDWNILDSYTLGMVIYAEYN